MLPDDDDNTVMGSTPDPKMAMADDTPEADTEAVTLGDDEPSDIIENEDGTTTIVMDDDTGVERDPEFYANLADDGTLDEHALAAIGSDLFELVEADLEARKKADEDYAEAMRRTGLDGDPPDGAEFEGASEVVVPMVTEACVDFAARAVKELFPMGGPDGGPAKMHIIGKPDANKVEKARRKAKFMNWQLTQQMPWFREELEQALTQVPMGGASYIKFYWNQARGRPDTTFVPIDDVIVPAAASSYATADRKTHRQVITGEEFARRIESGFYREIRDVVLGDPDVSEATQATRDIDGVEASSDNIDKARTIFEVQCTLDIADDERGDGPVPYIVTLDEPTQKVLAVYRNWREDDPDFEPLDHMVEFPFIPWRGSRPLSLPQMIGGLEKGATGALRALLDSAHANNMPGGFYLKGGGASKGGQDIDIRPGEFTPIEGAPGTTDDIRKMIMPTPLNPPSGVLYELLGFLVTQGKGVVQTAFENLSEQNPNAPVGTTLAMIEQGLTVFSAVHARLHAAMGRALGILYRLNAMYLKDEMQVREMGELLVRRADFDGPTDIVPVSDPNIFSETQRMAQVQMVSQRAAAMPQLYDLRKVELLLLERSKIPDAEELLLPVPEPKRLNAVNENVAAAMGQPLVAFPDQDHLMHLRMHVEFLMHPLFGQSQLIAPAVIPQMLTHLKDHVIYWYVSSVVNLGETVAGTDLTELMDDDEVVDHAFEGLLADLSNRVLQGADATLAPFQIPQVVQQAIGIMQQLQQMQQGGAPIDPGAAMMAEVERKAAADQRKAAIEAQEMELEAAKLDLERREHELKVAKLELEKADMQLEHGTKAQTAMERAALDREKMQNENLQKTGEIASRIAMNNSDNQTAMRIAQTRLASGQRPKVMTGTGINPRGSN